MVSDRKLFPIKLVFPLKMLFRALWAVGHYRFELAWIHMALDKHWLGPIGPMFQLLWVALSRSSLT